MSTFPAVPERRALKALEMVFPLIICGVGTLGLFAAAQVGLDGQAIAGALW
jgi:hypothetical protein